LHTGPAFSCIVLSDAWPSWVYVLPALQWSCQAVFTSWPSAHLLNLSQAVYTLTGASLITHTQSLRFTVILVQSAVWSSLECFPACLRGYPVLWSLPRGVNVSTFVSSPPEFHSSLSHAQVGGVFNGNWHFLSTYVFDSQGIHKYSAPSRRLRHVMAAAYRGQERLKPAPAPAEVTNARAARSGVRRMSCIGRVAYLNCHLILEFAVNPRSLPQSGLLAT
jgi:hypothetical protein